MLTSSPFARKRLRLWLGLIILATLPCYCLGLLAAYFAPDWRASTPTPNALLTHTATAVATRTPLPGFPTYQPLASPTQTVSATASPVSQLFSTPTSTAFPTGTATPPATATLTNIPSATMTQAPTETSAPTRTMTPTEPPTPEPSPTDTLEPSNPNP